MNNIKGIKVIEKASLKNYNTYKIESTCDYLIEISSINSLIETLKYLKNNNIPYMILGNGSNVILDDYIKGAIIKLSGLSYVSIDNKKVSAGAGAMMSLITQKTVDNNLSGLEWAINIPGTIGGSIAGNAGAYNSEMFDNLVSIKALNKDLEVVEIPKTALEYSYRNTNIKDLGLIVLEGTFILDYGNKEEMNEIIKDRFLRRQNTQPLDMPSCGSVFRNPEGNFAGKLIEDAGLKGKRIGDALVSTKHANFIVNCGNATSNDIKNLIKLIKDEIKNKYGIDLILEQIIVNSK